MKLQLDINFGDPVTPGPVDRTYPTLLGSKEFTIRGYPLETVLAEKITTAISLGDANTRERDWADVWRLTGRHHLAGSSVDLAFERTANYRGIALRPLSDAIVTLPTSRASAYSAWLRRQGIDRAEYPEAFSELIADVVEFADPLVTDDVHNKTWNPNLRRWEQQRSADGHNW